MRQLFTGNAELAVDHHAGGDDDRIVGLEEIVPGEVAADFDVAGKPQVGLGEQAVELADHRLGALVVGRNTRSNETEGCRQAIDDVDMKIGTAAQQAVGGVEARGARPYDGNPVSHVDSLSTR